MVADFIGSINMFEGRVTENGADHVRVRAADSDSEFYIDHGMSIKEGSKVWVALRPEKIRVKKEIPDNPGDNQLKGVVEEIGYLGSISTYKIKVGENGQFNVTWTCNIMFGKALKLFGGTTAALLVAGFVPK